MNLQEVEYNRWAYTSCHYIELLWVNIIYYTSFNSIQQKKAQSENKRTCVWEAQVEVLALHSWHVRLKSSALILKCSHYFHYNIRFWKQSSFISLFSGAFIAVIVSMQLQRYKFKKSILFNHCIFCDFLDKIILQFDPKIITYTSGNERNNTKLVRNQKKRWDNSLLNSSVFTIKRGKIPRQLMLNAYIEKP